MIVRPDAKGSAELSESAGTEQNEGEAGRRPPRANSENAAENTFVTDTRTNLQPNFVWNMYSVRFI
jgi:hypothetical protein